MALEFEQKPTNSSFPTLAGITRQFNRGVKVSAKERLFFTERLALLLHGGVNLHAALQALKKQTDSAVMINIVESLSTQIAEGKPFSQALTQHPEAFSKTYVNLIAASENGGFMPEVLEELLEMEEKREKLRATLFSALSYPVFLMLFSVAVVIFVLVVVFPKFAMMFESIRDQLPATTVTLMWMSDTLKNHWLALTSINVLGFVAFRHWMTSPVGSRWLDRLKLRIPLIKDVFVQLYLLQSLRVMSLSLKNGVGIMDTLAACREVVRNSEYRQLIAQIEAKVEEGGGLAAGFAQSRFIPPLVQQMIATGEETGNLPKVMTRIADFYERELSKRLTALSKIAEPMMLLIMGVVVGILVTSLILPIFKLSRAIY